MGAGYKTANRSIIQFGSGGIIPVNSTRYFCMDNAAAENSRQIPISHAGVIRNLYIHATAAPGAAETFVYTIMINGIATAITVTFAGALETEGNDVVNAVAVDAGDLITLRIVTSLNANATYHHAMCDLVG